MAAFKVWQAVLTTAEMTAEMRCYIPQRVANLFEFHAFTGTGNDATLDLSGNGRTLTANGTPAITTGPPIPWDLFDPPLIVELRPVTGGVDPASPYWP